MRGRGGVVWDRGALRELQGSTKYTVIVCRCVFSTKSYCSSAVGADGLLYFLSVERWFLFLSRDLPGVITLTHARRKGDPNTWFQPQRGNRLKNNMRVVKLILNCAHKHAHDLANHTPSQSIVWLVSTMVTSTSSLPSWAFIISHVFFSLSSFYFVPVSNQVHIVFVFFSNSQNGATAVSETIVHTAVVLPWFHERAMIQFGHSPLRSSRYVLHFYDLFRPSSVA